jgi:hypothetical protein
MPSRSTAIALLALFLAVGGTAVAAKKLIDGRTIKPRSITTSKLTKSAVKSLRRAAAQPVTGARIVDGTVTGSDLAPGSVGNDQVVDRSLTAGKLVADTITSNEVGVGAVGESELAPNSVGNSEIRANSISRNLLRANVIRVARVVTDLGTVPAGECALGNVDESIYQLPTGAFENAVVQAELLGEAPAGLLVDARSPDGSNLVIQVCNLSNSAVSLADRTFAIAALGT